MQGYKLTVLFGQVFCFCPDIFAGHIKPSFHEGLGHLHVHKEIFLGSPPLLDVLLPNVDQQELHLHKLP